jgi:hypothetical protein
MRRALLLVLLAGCGQPEDQLVIEGRVTGIAGGDSTGVPVTLYRDVGATELGCSAFSEWQRMEAGDAGVLHLEHVRHETTGRFGLPRCLRLTWKSPVATANLSWVGRTRNTQLPDLLTWFDSPGVDLAFAQGRGPLPSLPPREGVTAQLPSLEVRDARGVIFRQPAFMNLTALLDGPGPAPAVSSELIGRAIQRVQERQSDELGQEPLAQFEYRIETRSLGFEGNRAFIELAKGSACNVAQPGGSACAVTDGLFEPVDLPTGELVLELPAGVAPSTVVLRGYGGTEQYAAVAIDAAAAPDAGFVPAGRTPVNKVADFLSTGTLEDPRPIAFTVVHRVGPPGPIARLRVRLEDANGGRVAMNWAAEVSVY